METIDGFYQEFFRRSLGYYRSWLGDLTDDPEVVLTGAEHRFISLGKTLAYGDDPRHTMAFSLFTCASLLCLYLELRDRGVDAHTFGARMLKALTHAAEEARTRREAVAPQQYDMAALRDRVELLREQGTRSQAHRSPGEFEFDFHYQPGRPPDHLQEVYPERIRLIEN